MAAALLAAMLGACSSGGGGDPRTKIDPDPLGTGLRIQDVMGDATWLNPADAFSESCDIPPDYAVVVSGVTITAIDDFDETGKGARGNFYVQDTRLEPEPYTGMTVFNPSFSPPDLRLLPGDVADLNGTFMEFLGPHSSPFGGCKTLPEIGGTMKFRFENGATTPLTIPLADLRSYTTARPYMGMLVRVEGITIANNPVDSAGRYTVRLDVGGGLEQQDVPQISNELYDLKFEGPALFEGKTFSAVTGILTYFFGFRIAPRSPEDFEP